MEKYKLGALRLWRLGRQSSAGGGKVVVWLYVVIALSISDVLFINRYFVCVPTLRVSQHWLIVCHPKLKVVTQIITAKTIEHFGRFDKLWIKLSSWKSMTSLTRQRTDSSRTYPNTADWNKYGRLNSIASNNLKILCKMANDGFVWHSDGP